MIIRKFEEAKDMSGKIKKEKCFFSFFLDNIIIYIQLHYFICPHSRPLPLSFFTLLPSFFFCLYIVSPPPFHYSIQHFRGFFFFASKWVLTAENLLIENKRLLEIKIQMIEKKRTLLFHHGLTTTPSRPPISDLTGTEHGR